MSKTKVLIVEDDQEIACLNDACPEAEGYNVSVVHDGNLALEAIRNTGTWSCSAGSDAAPGGAQICRQAREFYNGIILVLTASADEMSEVSLFKFGADDYVTKPIRGHALLARIEALLVEPPAVETMDTGTENSVILSLINTAQSATLYGQNQVNSCWIWNFNLLVNNICQVVTRDQCWGHSEGLITFNDRSIDMRVSGLRRASFVYTQKR